MHRRLGHDPDRAARRGPPAVEPRLVLWNPAVRAARRRGAGRRHLVPPGRPGRPARQARAAHRRPAPAVLRSSPRMARDPAGASARPAAWPRAAGRRAPLSRSGRGRDRPGRVRARHHGRGRAAVARGACRQARGARRPRRSRGNVPGPRPRARERAADRGVHAGRRARHHRSRDRRNATPACSAWRARSTRATPTPGRQRRRPYGTERGPGAASGARRGPYVGVLEATWSFAAGRRSDGTRCRAGSTRGSCFGCTAAARCSTARSRSTTAPLTTGSGFACPTGLAGSALLTGAQFGTTWREPVPSRMPSPSARDAGSHRAGAPAGGSGGGATRPRALHARLLRG